MKKITDELAEILWDRLGDIPIVDDEDGEECIDEDFNVPELNVKFTKGTDRYYIWHWFEDTFDLSIYEDLMFKNPADGNKI